jgi:hypothetical protein
MVAHNRNKLLNVWRKTIIHWAKIISMAGWIWRLHGKFIGVEVIRKYIRNQREHHRKKTFQEEYIELFNENGIEFDEKYLW